jgi:hypothetical protein
MQRRVLIAGLASVAAITAATAIAALTAAEPAEARVLVRYDISGGFADIERHVEVETDGTCRGAGGRFDVRPSKMRSLRRALKASEFDTLKRVYKPKYPVSDGQVQRITYRGRTVAIESGADVPERLARLIHRLDRLR